jgi:putative photosynthetic complex assembly protein
MSDHSQAHEHENIRVPTGALIGAGLLILFTIATVGIFRLTGQEPTAQIPPSEQVLNTRELKFEDGDDGSVLVYEAGEDGVDQVIHVVRSGEGGFIRGVLRSLARARNASGISREHPFLLELHASGTLVLEDPQTGQRIDLQAFGPSNIAAFRALLHSDVPPSPGPDQNGAP